jgi:hypothetical protein
MSLPLFVTERISPTALECLKLLTRVPGVFPGVETLRSWPQANGEIVCR